MYVSHPHVYLYDKHLEWAKYHLYEKNRTKKNTRRKFMIWINVIHMYIGDSYISKLCAVSTKSEDTLNHPLYVNSLIWNWCSASNLHALCVNIYCSPYACTLRPYDFRVCYKHMHNKPKSNSCLLPYTHQLFTRLARLTVYWVNKIKRAYKLFIVLSSL